MNQRKSGRVFNRRGKSPNGMKKKKEHALVCGRREEQVEKKQCSLKTSSAV